MQAIRVGIGGWNFPPWRGPFYPPGLPHARELAYASEAVTSIEINATYYGTQKAASFRSWNEQTPDGFVFSVKGSRFTTNRRDLTTAGESIARFLDSGVLELGDKLGPILWQFPPTRRFDAAEMRPFLEALPHHHAGRSVRHVIEARHPSFADAHWMALLREFGVAHAIVESGKHTLLGDLTAGFVYARLENNDAAAPEGYATPGLDAWADRARRWASGEAVTELPCAGPPDLSPASRECFVYFISGDKVRAPDSARALLRRLGER